MRHLGDSSRFEFITGAQAHTRAGLERTIVDDGARALEATRRTFDGLGAPCSLPVNLSSFREFSPCR